MSNLNRLAKLELATNEHRRQRKQKPLTDYSTYTDEELKNLFDIEVAKMALEPSPYAGMSDQELSDLYMQSIQEGNRKAKKVKAVK